MLNKSREEVLDNIAESIEQNLSNISLQNGNWNYSGNGYYNTVHDNKSDSNFDAPQAAAGWPPEILEYIKRVALVTAASIVEAIYTEQELEAKVDRIILEEDTIQP